MEIIGAQCLVNVINHFSSVFIFSSIMIVIKEITVISRCVSQILLRRLL